MTQYVGCDHARTLLEGLIDGELSMADQLAVESHLRWCETCALRVSQWRDHVTAVPGGCSLERSPL